MKAFYKSLFTASPNRDQYREVLALITRASRNQVNAMASDLAWQSWDAQTANQSEA